MQRSIILKSEIDFEKLIKEKTLQLQLAEESGNLTWIQKAKVELAEIQELRQTLSRKSVEEALA